MRFILCDALSSLSSIGLLKRAQRMMATGLGPRSIEEDDDGIVTATAIVTVSTVTATASVGTVISIAAVLTIPAHPAAAMTFPAHPSAALTVPASPSASE